MDRLPRELIDAILQQCVAQGPKNNVLRLRLVCRLFDRILKPAGCCTLGLDFSRMSRASHVRRPDVDALQTIGYHCKSLYIDLMVLRDESECYSLSKYCLVCLSYAYGHQANPLVQWKLISSKPSSPGFPP